MNTSRIAYHREWYYIAAEGDATAHYQIHFPTLTTVLGMPWPLHVPPSHMTIAHALQTYAENFTKIPRILPSLAYFLRYYKQHTSAH